jgi:transcriptional regulator with XRE-family HTH domain
MKAKRKELNISQAELAEKIGTSPNYISKIEAEKQFPSVQMIEQIAGALKIDSVDLFSLEKIQENKFNEIEKKLRDEINKSLQLAFQELQSK